MVFYRKKKLLVILNGGIGNSILAIPLLMELKRFFPDHLRVLLGTRHIMNLLNIPELADEVHIVEKIGFFKHMLFKDIKIASKYEYCFFPLSSNDNYNIKRVLKYGLIKKIIKISNSRSNTSKEINIQTRSDLHEVNQNLSMLQSLGKNPNYSTKPNLFIKQNEIEQSKKLLLKYGLHVNDFVVFHLGWRRDAIYKAFPINVLDKILFESKISKKQKVIIFGKDEKPLINFFLNNIKYRNLILIDSIQNLRELAAFMKCSRLVISSDTGPMHIASASGANVIALFGPSSIIRCNPLGEGKIQIISGHIVYNCTGCHEYLDIDGCISARECLTKFNISELDMMIDNVYDKNS